MAKASMELVDLVDEPLEAYSVEQECRRSCGSESIDHGYKSGGENCDYNSIVENKEVLIVSHMRHCDGGSRGSWTNSNSRTTVLVDQKVSPFRVSTRTGAGPGQAKKSLASKESATVPQREMTLSTILAENTTMNPRSLGENRMQNLPNSAILWQFEKVLSFRKLTQSRVKGCSSIGCELKASCLWIECKQLPFGENRRSHYVCVDCQETRFGGWPSPEVLCGKGYMKTEMIEAIVTHCSKREHPPMPPPRMVCLDPEGCVERTADDSNRA